jgi:hypothetical protein
MDSHHLWGEHSLSLIGLEISLNSVSFGENGPFFKKLINSDWLAFTCQMENVMKRVTLGEPIKKPVFSGVYKLTQNPGG